MLKRWITITLIIIVASACSINTSTSDDPDGFKDVLVSTSTQSSNATETETPHPTSITSQTDTPEPTASSVPDLTPTQDDIAVGPDNFPDDVNPLTGLQVSDPTILDRRPVAVKVQIFPRGQRPPMGISQADIVYDYYQNAGMTRFHAIFYGENATPVGPIRSGRLLDRDLAQMYKSYLVFGSADQRILDTFTSSDVGSRLILEWTGKCPPMCRQDPNGSNILVADTAEVSIYASENKTDNTKQNLDGMTFKTLTPDGGIPIDQISVRFSIGAYNRWEYDPDNGKYYRYQDTQEANTIETELLNEMVDKNTEEQLSTDNVVVLLVPHSYAFNSKPGNNEIMNIKLEGTGIGYAFRDGMVYEVEWHRPEKDSILYLTMSDGSAYAFKPGRTWFEVIGTTSEIITTEGDNSYRFEWGVP